MEHPKELWFEPGKNPDPDLLEKAGHLGMKVLVLDKEELMELVPGRLPVGMELAVRVKNEGEAKACLAHPAAERVTRLLCTEPRIALRLKENTGLKTGWISQVDDAAGLEKTVAETARQDLILVGFKDPTNIPLELILARSQASGTRILKSVATVTDGELSLKTMEHGCHGLALRTRDLQTLVDMAEVFHRSLESALKLEPAKVLALSHAGMGDRVCIDTTSVLGQDEGMILGAGSSGGLMTCSETHYLPYMNLRPFRVNAGAVHLYVWGPEGRALYLSDLKAGDRLWAVNSRGRAREVTVGRIKVERRPLLLVEAQVGDNLLKTFIQDDWHVRLFGSQGEIRPSSEIRPGDLLLGFQDQPGRHVGLAIKEKIQEQ